MKLEEKRAAGGQAYDSVCSTPEHRGSNKARCLLPTRLLPTVWKAGRGKLILHHFVCKGTSKSLIIKFNPEQKHSQKMQLAFCLVPAWTDRTKPTSARGKKLHRSYHRGKLRHSKQLLR